jgi:hypothetical protein
VALPASILDEVLRTPEFSNAVAQAERDLPSDYWEHTPFRYNSSRARREAEVARTMLAEIEPRLKTMGVTDLVRALKVYDYPMLNTIPGVAGYVYLYGNQMIIGEIKSRPTSELAVLPGLADDKLQVYEGEQGYLNKLSQVIYFQILGTNASPKFDRGK